MYGSIVSAINRKRQTSRIQQPGLGHDPAQRTGELGQPEAPSPTGDVKIEPLGMTLAGITPELKSQYSIPDTAKGLVVTEVAPDSPAADESLRPGDLVVEVAQEPVR